MYIYIYIYIYNTYTRQSYLQLCIARALVGIGEASYVTVAPTLLSDIFTQVCMITDSA